MSEPLTGSIVDAKVAYESMRQMLSEVQGAEIWLISAYLKSSALRNITADLDSTNRVIVLTRWATPDLASGVSDLDSYRYAASRGWRFLVRLDLHAKAYRIGNAAIFLGSGNLTNKGFSIQCDGNLETMVRVDANDHNIAALDRTFRDAIELDNDRFLELEQWLITYVDTAEKQGITKSPLEQLWDHQGSTIATIATSECFLSDGAWLKFDMPLNPCELDDAAIHDLSLLGLCSRSSSGVSVKREDVVKRILGTRIVRWLQAIVENTAGHEVYFGALSAELHMKLLDDPKPYRKDVKLLVANLLSWLEKFPEAGLFVDRPNYSQRVYQQP
jgi:hypothetical protein